MKTYATVTELPGNGATREQQAMVYTRYHLAARFSNGKDVLEVACGPGMGLGYLAKTARIVVGGDYDGVLLDHARAHYRNRVRLLQLDAHALPFATHSFDVVILFEAIYYLEHPEGFLSEVRRVLRSGGTLLVCTVNKGWSGFNPSEFAHRYFSVPELAQLLHTEGFSAEFFGGFPTVARTMREQLLGAVRHLAVQLHLIPKTMKGKALLKMLVYGKLSPLPPEVHDAMASLSTLTPLAATAEAENCKVLYAIARAQGEA